MAYPSNIYPAAPGFPAGHKDIPWGEDLYTAISAYIPAMVTDANLIFDHEGNIELGAAYGIKWDTTTRISLSGGEIAFTSLSITTALIGTAITLTNCAVTGDIDVTDRLTISAGGNASVTGSTTCDYVLRDIYDLTSAAEPSDPADDNAVLWLSNGTGYGDNLDFCCKTTEGSGTNSFTIIDFSAL